MVLFGIGEYPPDFNPKIHGPYDPSRYYGKPDKSFTQVKINELLPWIKRRDFNPVAIARGMGRGFWKWQQTWVLPKKAGGAGLIQAMMVMSFYYYINQYPHLKYHRHCKYH